MNALGNSLLLLLLVTAGSLRAFCVPAPARGVDAVGLTVSDMDRSVDFYSHVLHFEKLSDGERAGSAVEHLKGVFGVRVRVVRMRLGQEQIELSEYLTPRGRPVPANATSNDLAFQHLAIVVDDMDGAYAWLRQNHVQYVSSGPQTLPAWNPQAGGIQAFYFQDPDRHVLEIIHFPAGKGDPRWQQQPGSLFEGIDHTAIVVSDSKKSIAFYRDLLGMRVTGTSENYGDEQEHLNSVFGARLRITSLRGAHGPGVELLEYLVPRTGRPIPSDQRANDVAHWETIMGTDDVAQAWSDLSARRVRMISTEPEGVDGDGPHARRGFLAQDPDGHVLEVLSESPSAAQNDDNHTETGKLNP